MAKKTTQPTVEETTVVEETTPLVEETTPLVEVIPQLPTYQVTDEQINEAINQLMSILTIDVFRRDTLVSYLNSFRNA